MTAAMTTRFNTATCINYAKGKSNRNRNNRVFHHQPESCYFGQHHSCRSSLFDISGGNNHGQATVTAANTCHQYLLTTNKQRGGGNQRRRSVPQDIFIRSLNNYTA